MLDSEEQPTPAGDDSGFDRFRGYLHVLARAAIGPQWERRFDASDIVQETLLEAHRNRHQLRGRDPRQLAAWLRTILGRNLGQAMRDHQRARRDLRRYVPIYRVLEQSSARLAACAADSASSPSKPAQRDEAARRTGEAIFELGGAQQEAIVALYVEGLPIDEVARRMERTPVAVTMLARRGLARLRELLKGR